MAIYRIKKKKIIDLPDYGFEVDGCVVFKNESPNLSLHLLVYTKTGLCGPWIRNQLHHFQMYHSGS